MFFAIDAYTQTDELEIAKAKIAELFKTMTHFGFDKDSRTPQETRTFIGWGGSKNVFVFDDRIEFRKKKENAIIYYFADLPDINISKGRDQYYNENVTIKDILVHFKGNITGSQLIENLNIIKNYYTTISDQLIEEKYNIQLDLFMPIAADYRSLTVKPPITEIQRERIIQANLFNQQRQYDKAIEYYIKAIEVDPTAYPSAYTNLALLSAQVRDFRAAIYYMKKYLMLEPDAEDARSCQDKIYEWKALLGYN